MVISVVVRALGWVVGVVLAVEARRGVTTGDTPEVTKPWEAKGGLEVVVGEVVVVVEVVVERVEGRTVRFCLRFSDPTTSMAWTQGHESPRGHPRPFEAT